MVEEGQRVAEGQVLAELDPTDSTADLDRLSHDLMVARLDVARLTALAAPEPPTAFVAPAGAPPALVQLQEATLTSAWTEHQAALAALDGRIIEREAEVDALRAGIGRLDRLLPNIRERVDRRRELAAEGYAPRLTYLELEQELIDAEEQRRVERHRLEEAQAALAALLADREQAIALFRRDVLVQLAEADRRAESVRQDVIKATERQRRQTLRAPVSGTVQKLRLHTIGDVVTPAEELMIVVPADASIEVEAFVLNKDAGWVADAQPVEIKVESFPFTKYGVVHGALLHVSRDAVDHETLGLVYPARIRLDETAIRHGERTIPLTPGLAVTAEIRTGSRRVLDYLLAPLLRWQDESLRER